MYRYIDNVDIHPKHPPKTPTHRLRLNRHFFNKKTKPHWPPLSPNARVQSIGRQRRCPRTYRSPVGAIFDPAAETPPRGGGAPFRGRSPICRNNSHNNSAGAASPASWSIRAQVALRAPQSGGPRRRTPPPGLPETRSPFVYIYTWTRSGKERRATPPPDRFRFRFCGVSVVEGAPLARGRRRRRIRLGNSRLTLSGVRIT